MRNIDYDEAKRIEYTGRIRELLCDLPPFCREFSRGIENTASVLTRFGYLNDLKLFFGFLIEEGIIRKPNIKSIELSDLDALTPLEIEMFIEYVTVYSKGEQVITNDERSKARKLSAIRSIFKFFYKRSKLGNNPASMVDTPKIHRKPIIRLDVDEVANLLDIVENGDGLTERQKSYHRSTRDRDLAILTLFLGTGIRISELVGINVSDVNFMANEFVVTRKGGNKDVLAFGDEVRKALLLYQLQREKIAPKEGHEDALFLSGQRKRITVRAVENLVKKYASIAAPLKRISPHKLRSTYGTMLYNETGDIYLVAEVLGHKDVNTTQRHYATFAEDRKRMAANIIKLRDEDECGGSDKDEG